MKKLMVVTLLLLSGVANAAVKRMDLDIKLPTQAVVEKQTISAPDAAGSADILSAHAGSTANGAPVEVTSFVAQPDVPRNLVVTPGGTTNDVRASSVVLYGSDMFGRNIMEVLAVADNASSAITGSLAFRTVTKVVLPGEEGSHAATWSVGWGEKLGMKSCMDEAGHLVLATLDGAYEATRPTMAIGSSVASNTADVNGAMNGSKDVELFFFQNFLCQP